MALDAKIVAGTTRLEREEQQAARLGEDSDSDEEDDESGAGGMTASRVSFLQAARRGGFTGMRAGASQGAQGASHHRAEAGAGAGAEEGKEGEGGVPAARDVDARDLSGDTLGAAGVLDAVVDELHRNFSRDIDFFQLLVEIF